MAHCILSFATLVMTPFYNMFLVFMNRQKPQPDPYSLRMFCPGTWESIGVHFSVHSNPGLPHNLGATFRDQVS